MKKNNFYIFVLSFMSIFIFAGLANSQLVNKIVAVVNDQIITARDVDKFLLPLRLQLEMQYEGRELEERLNAAHEDLLQRMINDILLIQEAEKIGLTVSNEAIENRLETIRKDFETEQDFNEALEEAGLTISDLKQRYKEQILIDRLIEREIKSKIDITPQQIIDYYNQNKDEFIQPEKIKLKQIFIPIEEKDAIDTIFTVKELLEQNEDFSKLAKKYSKGINADRGGVIGIIGRGELMYEIDKVVFNLNEGEISNVVTTPVGYHIFKIDEKYSASSYSLEEVRFHIRDILFNEKAHEYFLEYIQKLRNSAYVFIH